VKDQGFMSRRSRYKLDIRLKQLVRLYRDGEQFLASHLPQLSVNLDDKLLISRYIERLFLRFLRDVARRAKQMTCFLHQVY
jgi:hypothetical protein